MKDRQLVGLFICFVSLCVGLASFVISDRVNVDVALPYVITSFAKTEMYGGEGVDCSVYYKKPIIKGENNPRRLWITTPSDEVDCQMAGGEPVKVIRQMSRQVPYLIRLQSVWIFCFLFFGLGAVMFVFKSK